MGKYSLFSCSITAAVYLINQICKLRHENINSKEGEYLEGPLKNFYYIGIIKTHFNDDLLRKSWAIPD